MSDPTLINTLIDHIVTGADAQEWRNSARLQIQSGAFLCLSGSARTRRGAKPPRWAPAEDEFLRCNLGYLSEEEIAEALGRSVMAVHLRWRRDLRLPAPSRAPGWLTANQAAVLLGVDSHKITHWCDVGLIPSRRMPGDRQMRLIRVVTLERWVVTTDNWIYIDWRQIPDARLRRLCELRQQRWGDEWWTTAQVADLHGVSGKDVLRLILRGEIPATQAKVSRSGRHHERNWSNWYVLKSHAVDARFVRGKGNSKKIELTPAALNWIRRARDMGWNWSQIARSMKSGSAQTIQKRFLAKMSENS